MKRHACHFNRLTIYLPTRSERNAQEFGRNDRVIKKHFIKIAHTIKQQLIRTFCLNAKILFHHRRNRRFAHNISRKKELFYLDWGKVKTVSSEQLEVSSYFVLPCGKTDYI